MKVICKPRIEYDCEPIICCKEMKKLFKEDIFSWYLSKNGFELSINKRFYKISFCPFCGEKISYE